MRLGPIAGNNLTFTLSFANNCTLSMTTEQRETVAYLSKVRAGANAKKLALGRNAQADKLLSGGKATSDYDDSFKSVMKDQLGIQARRIATAGTAATSQLERDMLAKHDNSTKLLLQQLETQEP